MSSEFQGLFTSPRLLMEAELVPLQGERFQSTGFPDLGPATYESSDGKNMLLVESAQSVANRLELSIWNEGKGKLIEGLEGLPYISVGYNGDELTNSIIESHRLNSPYILEGQDDTILKILQEEVLTKDFGHVDFKAFARTLIKYDPNSIIHGIFISKSEVAGGRLRLARALSGFIEASDMTFAESGGVKFDMVDPSGDTSKGFGHVPFHRTEFTAEKIIAYFNIDIALLGSYGLSDNTLDLLIALSLLKIRRFLNEGLRLRTACDLSVKNGLVATNPANFEIPDEETLMEITKRKIADVTNEGLFAKPPITHIKWVPKKSTKQK